MNRQDFMVYQRGVLKRACAALKDTHKFNRLRACIPGFYWHYTSHLLQEYEHFLSSKSDYPDDYVAETIDIVESALRSALATGLDPNRVYSFYLDGSNPPFDYLGSRHDDFLHIRRYHGRTDERLDAFHRRLFRLLVAHGWSLRNFRVYAEDAARLTRGRQQLEDFVMKGCEPIRDVAAFAIQRAWRARMARRHAAARVVQQAWFRACTDPARRACRNRLQWEFEHMQA